MQASFGGQDLAIDRFQTLRNRHNNRLLSHGDDVKSTVRVFARPEDMPDAFEWMTDYVIDTCKVRTADRATKYLGGVLGMWDQIDNGYNCVIAKTTELHNAVIEVDDPATQMVLRSSCAGVNKVTYLLRLNTEKFNDDELRFRHHTARRRRQHLRRCHRRICLVRETIECNRGGLGLRSATELALPAFRLGARHLFVRIEEAGLASATILTQAYD